MSVTHFAYRAGSVLPLCQAAAYHTGDAARALLRWDAFDPIAEAVTETTCSDCLEWAHG